MNKFNRCFKKHYFLIFCIAGFISTLLAVSRPFAQEISQAINQESQVTHQGPSSIQIPAKLSSRESQTIQLSAEEFHFESHVDFPSSVLTNPDQYTESITHQSKGTFNITLINQGSTVRYLFQVSSLPEQSCETDSTRACQQAAHARGDIAEIQIVLQGNKLLPATYPFEDRATPIEDVTVYSRQLYSDPAHGKLGCQAWGAGALNVNKAVYSVDGTLEHLDANLVRVCNQTSPFPTTLPEDNLLQLEVENIEQYTYYASWCCRMKRLEKRM